MKYEIKRLSIDKYHDLKTELKKFLNFMELHYIATSNGNFIIRKKVQYGLRVANSFQIFLSGFDQVINIFEPATEFIFICEIKFNNHQLSNQE